MLAPTNWWESSHIGGGALGADRIAVHPISKDPVVA